MLLIASAAFVSGSSILLLKVSDTIFQMGDFVDNIVNFIILGIATIYTADTQLQFLNEAIKLYDQMECIPIYQTFILFSWTSLGMIIFNEYRFYNILEIAGIFASAGVCLFGVRKLAQKHQKTAEDEAQELELACATRT